MFAGTAVVTASAMLFWGTGLHPLWFLTWFAPLPVLLISSRLGRWGAFSVGALSWFLGSLNMWHYLLVAIALPLPLVLVLSVIPGCLFGLGVVLFRKFLVRDSLWKAALAFPTFWVTCEYVNNVTSPHGTFPNMSYTQMDLLPLLQVTSVVGIWGISFCLFLLPATITAVLGGQGSARDRTRLAIAVTAFLAALDLYGSWRLASTPAPQYSVKVGLMATGVDTTFPHDDSAALQLLRDYSGKLDGLATQGAQVIVLPEKIALVSDQATKQVDALYTAAAARTKASLLVGLERGTLRNRFNEARLYSPDGILVVTYDKHHMVPKFEDADQPGTTVTVLDQASGVWGIQICKDMDFPGLSRQYGSKGVGLLLVPAWDFTLDDWLHDRMAVMRGVEDGFTIVRAAKQGLLTVSDDRGRILAQQDAATVPFASLLATAPVRHNDTFYVRWGDWFAWLNIAGLVALLLSPSRKPRREKNRHQMARRPASV
ncbi:MAG TPA: nitrilase-related carbon-nitrogen hydrolase [Terriglobales bacterium]|nr:nitrilase-related carbon-nitrogen hydrolase [Terriglobales bacterium]